MEYRNETRNLLLVIVAGTTTAALLYCGTGLHPIWPLLSFTPIPIIAIAPQLLLVCEPRLRSRNNRVLFRATNFTGKYISPTASVCPGR